MLDGTTLNIQFYKLPKTTSQLNEFPLTYTNNNAMMKPLSFFANNSLNSTKSTPSLRRITFILKAYDLHLTPNTYGLIKRIKTIFIQPCLISTMHTTISSTQM